MFNFLTYCNTGCITCLWCLLLSFCFPSYYTNFNDTDSNKCSFKPQPKPPKPAQTSRKTPRKDNDSKLIINKIYCCDDPANQKKESRSCDCKTTRRKETGGYSRSPKVRRRILSSESSCTSPSTCTCSDFNSSDDKAQESSDSRYIFPKPRRRIRKNSFSLPERSYYETSKYETDYELEKIISPKYSDSQIHARKGPERHKNCDKIKSGRKKQGDDLNIKRATKTYFIPKKLKNTKVINKCVVELKPKTKDTKKRDTGTAERKRTDTKLDEALKKFVKNVKEFEKKKQDAMERGKLLNRHCKK